MTDVKIAVTSGWVGRVTADNEKIQANILKFWEYSISRFSKFCPLVTSDPLPDFVNKVFLDHSHTHLFTYGLGCFHKTMAKLRLYGLQSLNYLFSGPLQKKSADFYSISSFKVTCVFTYGKLHQTI